MPRHDPSFWGRSCPCVEEPVTSIGESERLDKVWRDIFLINHAGDLPLDFGDCSGSEVGEGECRLRRARNLSSLKTLATEVRALAKEKGICKRSGGAGYEEDFFLDAKRKNWK